ncbi:MAG TPA: histidine kinase dimerization/phospho-acceptor domain-containing protein [Planctomycetota bacterium]|nr:histidine kinase dimerization/phospho-acceptor domain-containing protein [Planctomycetota bacterium]
MNSSRRAESVQNDASSRFLQRIRESYSHDLRTPLSTIVNYAAVLESKKGPQSEETRDLGRRIRENALRTARMIQQMAVATELANRSLRPAPTDLTDLARSVLVDLGGEGVVDVVSDAESSMAEVDAGILEFAWRAYVGVENDAARKPLDQVGLEIRKLDSELVIDIWRGERVPSPELLEPKSYLLHDIGPARLECSMAFHLAHDLVVSHGGELSPWGHAGVGSGLRYRL